MLPRSDYEGRLERVRAAMAQAGATALAVHGHPGNYGALAYLTGFTSKLGATLALVPREGPLRILAPGTPKMMDIAKRLTWVEDVRPLGNVTEERRRVRRRRQCARHLGLRHSAAGALYAASPERWRHARRCRSIKRSMRCGGANRRAKWN